jgi:hypothetical protein
LSEGHSDRKNTPLFITYSCKHRQSYPIGII